MAVTREDNRLARITSLCLALPGTSREMCGKHATLRVGKKTLAYYLDDHHGDGIVGLCCKVIAGENKSLIAANPDRFYMPAYVGSRGWVGLRLDRGEIDWEEVEELIKGSYRLVAPKRLVASVKY